MNGYPLNINLSAGNVNDAEIIINQLDDLVNSSIKKNNTNIFIGDAAYDSNNIRAKLKELNIGELLADKNKRNTKNINLLNNYRLDDKNRHFNPLL